jgi:hypothetical protein
MMVVAEQKASARKDEKEGAAGAVKAEEEESDILAKGGWAATVECGEQAAWVS